MVGRVTEDIKLIFWGVHTDELTKVTCQVLGGCLLLYCMAVITPIGALMVLPLALSPILPRQTIKPKVVTHLSPPFSQL